eukprot:scaffold11783_cov120-Cylindrotheca_fusiformis.AAC.16
MLCYMNAPKQRNGRGVARAAVNPATVLHGRNHSILITLFPKPQTVIDITSNWFEDMSSDAMFQDRFLEFFLTGLSKHSLTAGNGKLSTQPIEQCPRSGKALLESKCSAFTVFSSV